MATHLTNPLEAGLQGVLQRLCDAASGLNLMPPRLLTADMSCAAVWGFSPGLRAAGIPTGPDIRFRPPISIRESSMHQPSLANAPTGARTVVITGANTGLGFACAKAILKSPQGASAHIVLACRDKGRAQAAVDQLTRDTGPGWPSGSDVARSGVARVGPGLCRRSHREAFYCESRSGGKIQERSSSKRSRSGNPLSRRSRWLYHLQAIEQGVGGVKMRRLGKKGVR